MVPMKRSVVTKKKGSGSHRSDKAAVNAYLASLPDQVRIGPTKLRNSIAAAAPGAEPGISYGIPAFRLNGRPLAWFAAFKQHSSFFPGAGAIRIHAADLKKYKTSKGTIQFPHGKPPTAALVAKLVRARIKEMQNSGR
jgi:uncharacterized protein YdhG (YjbR/CyaY superfamily)